jgi:hypothetical protein
MWASAILPVMIGLSPVTSVWGSREPCSSSNVHARSELLEVKAAPIHADFVTDPPGFLE